MQPPVLSTRYLFDDPWVSGTCLWSASVDGGEHVGVEHVGIEHGACWHRAVRAAARIVYGRSRRNAANDPGMDCR